MIEDKEAVEAKIPTKDNRAIKSLMTQTRARKEEVTLVDRGGPERTQKFEKRVAVGHVESQTILKETVLGKNKETEGSRVIMHQNDSERLFVMQHMINSMSVDVSTLGEMYGMWIHVPQII